MGDVERNNLVKAIIQNFEASPSSSASTQPQKVTSTGHDTRGHDVTSHAKPKSAGTKTTGVGIPVLKEEVVQPSAKELQGSLMTSDHSLAPIAKGVDTTVIKYDLPTDPPSAIPDKPKNDIETDPDFGYEYEVNEDNSLHLADPWENMSKNQIKDFIEKRHERHTGTRNPVPLPIIKNVTHSLNTNTKSGHTRNLPQSYGDISRKEILSNTPSIAKIQGDGTEVHEDKPHLGDFLDHPIEQENMTSRKESYSEESNAHSPAKSLLSSSSSSSLSSSSTTEIAKPLSFRAKAFNKMKAGGKSLANKIVQIIKDPDSFFSLKNMVMTHMGSITAIESAAAIKSTAKESTAIESTAIESNSESKSAVKGGGAFNSVKVGSGYTWLAGRGQVGKIKMGKYELKIKIGEVFVTGVLHARSRIINFPVAIIYESASEVLKCMKKVPLDMLLRAKLEKTKATTAMANVDDTSRLATPKKFLIGAGFVMKFTASTFGFGFNLRSVLRKTKNDLGVDFKSVSHSYKELRESDGLWEGTKKIASFANSCIGFVGKTIGKFIIRSSGDVISSILVSTAKITLIVLKGGVLIAMNPSDVVNRHSMNPTEQTLTQKAYMSLENTLNNLNKLDRTEVLNEKMKLAEINKETQKIPQAIKKAEAQRIPLETLTQEIKETSDIPKAEKALANEQAYMDAVRNRFDAFTEEYSRKVSEGEMTVLAGRKAKKTLDEEYEESYKSYETYKKEVNKLIFFAK